MGGAAAGQGGILHPPQDEPAHAAQLHLYRSRGRGPHGESDAHASVASASRAPEFCSGILPVPEALVLFFELFFDQPKARRWPKRLAVIIERQARRVTRVHATSRL